MVCWRWRGVDIFIPINFYKKNNVPTYMKNNTYKSSRSSVKK